MKEYCNIHKLPKFFITYKTEDYFTNDDSYDGPNRVSVEVINKMKCRMCVEFERALLRIMVKPERMSPLPNLLPEDNNDVAKFMFMGLPINY